MGPPPLPPGVEAAAPIMPPKSLDAGRFRHLNAGDPEPEPEPAPKPKKKRKKKAKKTNKVAKNILAELQAKKKK